MTDHTHIQKELSQTLSMSSVNSLPSDNVSTRAIYEVDASELTLSRPLSRGSITSNISMVGLKEGIEGPNSKRLGMTAYSSMLLNSINTPYQKTRKANPNEAHLMSYSISGSSFGGTNGSGLKGVSADEVINDARSVISNSQTYPDIPNAPPMTLPEKMRLLNVDRSIPTMILESTDSIDNTLLYDSNDQIPQNLENNLRHSVRHHHKLGPFNSGYGEVAGNNGGESLGLPLREGDLHGNHNAIGSEMESIASTLGDDASYLHGFRSVPPIISPVESYDE